MWISVVEDESTLNNLITKYLEKEGYNVRSYTTGEDALSGIDKPTDLWVIDIMLPDLDGFSVFKEVKNHDKNVYTIFISARNQDIDRVVGLELGCDDYIPKPFLVRELVIKVNKLLKATPRHAETIELPPYKIQLDNHGVLIKLYFIRRQLDKHTVLENGQLISLTVKEYDLLTYFAANPGAILSRTDILNKVWGYDYFGTDRVVDDTIRRLRRKLPKLLLDTVYGLGYRLNKEES